MSTVNVNKISHIDSFYDDQVWSVDGSANTLIRICRYGHKSIVFRP